MAALPQQVQEAVARLTAPEPVTEKDIATKLKGQVSELKNLPSRRPNYKNVWTTPKLSTSPSSQRCRSFSRNSMRAENFETNLGGIHAGGQQGP